MTEAELLAALVRGSPIAVAILALGFSVWKWILPFVRELRALDRETEAQREAARVARDATWQATQREIGQSNKEAMITVTAGFREALDRHDKAMDRYAAQHVALAADVGQVKVDVASMRSDLHAVVSRFAPQDASVALPPKKE